MGEFVKILRGTSRRVLLVKIGFNIFCIQGDWF